MPVKIKYILAWSGKGEGMSQGPNLNRKASDNWWLPREEELAFFKGSKWLTKLRWIAAQTPRNTNTHSITEPQPHPFPPLSHYMTFAGLVPLPSASRVAGIRKHRLPRSSLKQYFHFLKTHTYGQQNQIKITYQQSEFIRPIQYAAPSVRKEDYF